MLLLVALLRKMVKKKSLTSAEVRELRRKARIARKAQMAELERSKPSENSDDPQDIEAINAAKATMGNYLLKIAPGTIKFRSHSVSMPIRRGVKCFYWKNRSTQ